MEFSIIYRSYGANALCYGVLLTFRPYGVWIMQLMSPDAMIWVDEIDPEYAYESHGIVAKCRKHSSTITFF